MGYANVTDPITSVVVEVAVANVTMNKQFACGAYDASKTTPFAKLMPAIGGSASNFFEYQSTNGVGYGQLFYFEYSNETGLNPAALPCYNYTDPFTCNSFYY